MRQVDGKREQNSRCLQKGTKLKDRYIIEQVLGSGGFGVTYEAYDMLNYRIVAVKEFFVDGCMERDTAISNEAVVIDDEAARHKVERSLSNFKYEIAVMKLLENVPYISHIRDDFSENGTEYIVKDLLRGKTLAEYNKKDIAINTTELMESMEHVLIALEEMHELGIIHRDISPGNLFLTEDGDLYLIDFGTATSTDKDSEYRNEQVFEHKGFHAPEHNEIENQGPWTDIYSLCATIVYILTGEAVPNEVERQVLDPVPGLLMRCKLSATQQNVILKGLESDISKRLSSARELRVGLCGEIAENMGDMTVSYCAGTDIGSRKINQDNLLVDGLFYFEGEDFVKHGKISCNGEEIHLVAIFDGVGGAHSGELASRAAAQALNHFLEQYRNSNALPERLIGELVDQINEKIVTLGTKIGKTGTTMSFLLWRGNQYYAINIGDSPIFIRRKHKLNMLSVPHTLAQAKLMAGIEFSIHDRHTLSNYLGKPGVAGSQMVSYRHGYIKKGDSFLLCSDGVSDKIDLDRLKRYLGLTPELAIKSIRRSLSRHSNNDNCTAIVLKWR